MPKNVKVDEAEFMRLYDAGYGPREIADIMGVHFGTVRRTRQRLHLPAFTRKPGPLKAFDEERFLELYNRGYTAREISREMNADPRTVNRHRQHLKLPLCAQPAVQQRKRVERPRRLLVDREMLKALADQGLSNPEIARRLDCSPDTVGRILRDEFGIRRYIQPVYDQEIRDSALKLLQDGASYNEVSRTLGVRARTLSKWYPGMGWTYSQAAQYRKMKEKLDLLDNPAGPRIYS